MNFFEHQEWARRRTRLLIFYYVMAVLLIIAAVYLAVAVLVAGLSGEAGAPLWNPDLFFWVAAVTTAVIGLGTLYKVIELRAGGDKVARALGGRPVAPNTTDLAERRLLNLVEEMAIASGTPVPRVYVLDEEDGINAFAAGFSPQDAVIAVTRGALKVLNRDELQGVIGHEFSHILNGDMRLNLRLIGVLNGILIIAIAGYWIFRSALSSGSRVRSRSRKGGNPLPFVLLGLALMVIGYIGVFFGRLIKSAVSRQREFLADASAVQYTRNPGGIAGALKKIGGYLHGSRMLTPRAEEASHLFFANGLSGALARLMATHPPLEERIRRIDPGFDGRFPAAAVPTGAEPELVRAAVPPGPPPAKLAVRPAAVVASVGAPTPEHLAYAGGLLAALPTELRDAVRDPRSAQAVVLGLLLHPTGALRERQLARLSTHAAPAVYREILRLAPAVAAVPAAGRAALAELAVNALRHLTRPQYLDFRKLAFELCAADMQISLFEYALLRMLARNLDPLYGLAQRPAVRYHALGPVAPECILLLSTIAWFGNKDRAAAEQAFAQGLNELGERLHGAGLLPQERCSLEAVDHALEKLVGVAPRLKQNILAACVACVSADGQVTLDEAELLRAVADALECPIPPLLGQAAA